MYRDQRSSFRRREFYGQNLRPRRPRRRGRTLIGTAVVLVAITACIVGLLQFTNDAPKPNNRRPAASGHTATNDAPNSRQPAASDRTVAKDNGAAPLAGFNKTAHSTTDPGSIWVIANKQHALIPKTYQPDDLVTPGVPLRSNISSDERLLRTEPARALESLVKAANGAGVYLNLQSGYRSYNFQAMLYNGYVKQQGQAAADRTSARPGHSEHQTGLAADLGGSTRPACNVEKCYAETPEGTWLAANAYKYGFIIRYTETKEQVTGYDYEPWHIRYVGTGLAEEMHKSGIQTLEEFFGVTGGTAY